jgi:hypothetical protein
MTQLTNLRGVVRGRTIQLEEDLSVPDGETVTVTIAYEKSSTARIQSKDSLMAAAGSWADDDEGLDDFLEWNRQQRKESRPEIEP